MQIHSASFPANLFFSYRFSPFPSPIYAYFLIFFSLFVSSLHMYFLLIVAFLSLTSTHTWPFVSFFFPLFVHIIVVSLFSYQFSHSKLLFPFCSSSLSQPVHSYLYPFPSSQFSSPLHPSFIFPHTFSPPLIHISLPAYISPSSFPPFLYPCTNIIYFYLSFFLSTPIFIKFSRFSTGNILLLASGIFFCCFVCSELLAVCLFSSSVNGSRGPHSHELAQEGRAPGCHVRNTLRESGFKSKIYQNYCWRFDINDYCNCYLKANVFSGRCSSGVTLAKPDRMDLYWVERNIGFEFCCRFSIVLFIFDNTTFQAYEWREVDCLLGVKLFR